MLGKSLGVRCVSTVGLLGASTVRITPSRSCPVWIPPFPFPRPGRSPGGWAASCGRVPGDAPFVCVGWSGVVGVREGVAGAWGGRWGERGGGGEGEGGKGVARTWGVGGGGKEGGGRQLPCSYLSYRYGQSGGSWLVWD